MTVSPKKKMGRPKAQIDQMTFENMCAIFCTLDELCQVFNVTPKTLYRWVRDTYNDTFSNVYHIHAGKGKMSLRRAQFKLAQNNAQMAVWLGKVILGQTDDPNSNRQEQKQQQVQIIIKDETDEKRLDIIEKQIRDEANGRG